MKKIILLITTFTLLLTSCLGKTKANTEFLQWLNASNSIFIEYNDGNFKYYSGFKYSKNNKKFAQNYLENAYGITNSKELIDAISVLKADSTQKSFENHYLYLENYKDFEEDKLNTVNKDKNDWVIETYETLGDNALTAYDLSRSLMLISFGYLSDYITLENAFTYSLNISKKIQSKFDNWIDFNQSYLNGVYYLSETEKDLELYYELVDIENNLSTSKKTPYNINFDINLSNSFNTTMK